jgi:hypothetical protein
MADSTATLETPRAGAGASAEAKPGGGSAGAGSVTPATPETAESEGKGEVREYGTRILESLSPEARRKWKRTGLLPPDVELREPSERAIGEGEKLLSELSPEERKAWRERGVLPERKQDTKTDAKAGADESGGDKELAELSDRSSLAKVHSMTVRGADGKMSIIAGKEQDAEDLHKHAVATMPKRIKADWDSYDKADHELTLGAWKELGPLIPQGLVNYLQQVIQPHLHRPVTFWREFLRNQAFRAEVVKAGFEPGKGDLDKMTKVIAKFDAKHAPEPVRRVSSAPAPAASIAGRATAPIDEVAASVRGGDFSAYRRAANAEDFSRKRGGRR